MTDTIEQVRLERDSYLGKVIDLKSDLRNVRHQLALYQAALYQAEAMEWKAAVHEATKQRDQATMLLGQSQAQVERLREALEKARAQFCFYTNEHHAAGKHEKAATNRGYADMLEAALAPFSESPPAAEQDGRR